MRSPAATSTPPSTTPCGSARTSSPDRPGTFGELLPALPATKLVLSSDSARLAQETGKGPIHIQQGAAHGAQGRAGKNGTGRQGGRAGLETPGREARHDGGALHPRILRQCVAGRSRGRGGGESLLRRALPLEPRPEAQGRRGQGPRL